MKTQPRGWVILTKVHIGNDEKPFDVGRIYVNLNFVHCMEPAEGVYKGMTWFSFGKGAYYVRETPEEIFEQVVM